ncbi:MAG: ABC transporter permease [Alphaproteobacteria bacterium]|nr:ABC transporter permease [Alphaproteobacteria bacterium]
MKLSDCVRASVSSLRANVLRSILTTLGIIIGVGAVIAMVSIGAGAQSRVEDSIQRLGANLIMVMPGSQQQGGVNLGAGSRPSLSESDAVAIETRLDTIAIAAPSVRGNGQIIAGNLNWYTGIQGVTPGFFLAREWQLLDGREMTDQDVRRATKTAWLGYSVYTQLFPDQDGIGQTIRISRTPFEVAGVLAPKGQSGFGQDQDDVVFVPISTAKKRVLGRRSSFRGDDVQQIYLKVVSAEYVDIAEVQVAELLRELHQLAPGQEDDFQIRNMASFLEARAESQAVMTFLLAAVASVSLVVGGIGIMNIMLVSVTERTREIGLRLAVGAKRRDIRFQFLIEALMLSMIGGLIGVVAGIASATAIAVFGSWDVLLQPGSILLAFGFSAATGVFFGYYPAYMASQLNPIEALRHE